ncbi:MAG: hypothetical protein ACQER4_08675 [Bacteroidota bacterium]
MKNLTRSFGFLLAGLLFAVSCNTTNSGADETTNLQLQMQAQSQSSATTQSMSLQQQHGVVIEEVRLYIEEMELESIQEDSLDFENENFIVTLPLDGSSLLITEQDIPAGTYDEFELEIEKPDDDDDQLNDSDFRDETGSYSIVVKGLYQDEAFTFRSKEDFEIEMDLNPSLEFAGGNSVLMVSIDVSSWFKGADGEGLDPKDPANLERINENIEASFEAFEDDDDDDDDSDDDEDDDDDDNDDDDS